MNQEAALFPNSSVPHQAEFHFHGSLKVNFALQPLSLYFISIPAPQKYTSHLSYSTCKEKWRKKRSSRRRWRSKAVFAVFAGDRINRLRHSRMMLMMSGLCGGDELSLLRHERLRRVLGWLVCVVLWWFSRIQHTRFAGITFPH